MLIKSFYGKLLFERHTIVETVSWMDIFVIMAHAVPYWTLDSCVFEKKTKWYSLVCSAITSQQSEAFLNKIILINAPIIVQLGVVPTDFTKLRLR